MLRARVITLDGVLASVVAYQLIGDIRADHAQRAWSSKPRHLPGVPQPENFQWNVYFSFVTLATLGYGDIVPDTNLTRSVTILEAIIGQFYVAVIVALLVSSFISQRMQDQSGPPNNSK